MMLLSLDLTQRETVQLYGQLCLGILTVNFFKYYFRGILAFIGQRQCRQTERERHAAKGCRSDSNSGCYFLSHARLLTH